MAAVLSNFDLSKFWTRNVGKSGERMVTSIMLVFREHEGGGYKATANLAYLSETMHARNITLSQWRRWCDEKTSSVPNAVIVRLEDGHQGWIKVTEDNMVLLTKLADEGTLDHNRAQDVLMEWEDEAFSEQWKQLTAVLPDHVRVSFDQLPVRERKQLTWDAYVYAKARTQAEPVTTFTKAVLPVHILQMEWLRYAKAMFPYRKRGPVPKLA